MRIILALTLLLAGMASAATLEERRVELAAADGVLAAVTTQSLTPILPGVNLYVAQIRFAYAEGDVAEDQTVSLIGVNQGEVDEEVYWFGQLPKPLRVETKYLTSRTAGGWAALSKSAQESAIETFCNNYYENATAGDQDPIREFNVQPVSGDTVKVSGYFDVGTTWERQSWYAKLINIDAAPVQNTDVQFQRAYDEVAAP